MNDQTRSPLKV